MSDPYYDELEEQYERLYNKYWDLHKKNEKLIQAAHDVINSRPAFAYIPIALESKIKNLKKELENQK